MTPSRKYKKLVKIQGSEAAYPVEKNIDDDISRRRFQTPIIGPLQHGEVGKQTIKGGIQKIKMEI